MTFSTLVPRAIWQKLPGGTGVPPVEMMPPFQPQLLSGPTREPQLHGRDARATGKPSESAGVHKSVEPEPQLHGRDARATGNPSDSAGVLKSARPPFLLLAIACVLLGFGAAVYSGGAVSWLRFGLALLGAVAAHVSVNAYNEYQDFRSGLDARTERTPFSGGSGFLPAHPRFAPAVFGIATAALLLTCLIGLYFLWLRGAAMLYVGLPGVLIVASYTPWLIRRPWLCLVAPGLGFGTCMVLGTYVALTGHYSWTAGFASLVPFFFVSNLLLLNQFPDVEADRTVGRRHLPIVIGVKKSSSIYILFLLLGYLSIGAGVWLRYLPLGCLLGEATLLLAIPAMIRAYRYGEQREQLLPALGFNVIINLLTPVLMAVGFFCKF